MINFVLQNSTNHHIDDTTIQKGLAAAATKLGEIGERHVAIEIVTSEESQALNAELRGQDKPTDIISISTQETKVGEQVIEESAEGALSFEINESKPLENAWPVIGQLVLCYDVIAQNAQRAGQPVERELEWVIEHGILHLMGFHHEHDD
ncbi:MAG TPA: rRNA maturation RNase YbeY [Patescibacteria group bacterium]